MMRVDGASGPVNLPNAGSCYAARRTIESCSRGLVFAVSLLAAAMTWAQTEQDGERIYRKVCSLCHETRIGPGLLGRHLPQTAIQHIVRHGINGMPAFRSSEISDEEVAALGRFIERSAAPETGK